MFFRSGGTWPLIKAAWLHWGGGWRGVVRVYNRIGGVWYQVHPQPRRFDISPPVAGLSTWNLDTNGPLHLAGPGTWSIQPHVGFACYVRIHGGGGGGGASGKPDFGGENGAPGGTSTFPALQANGGGGGIRGRDGGAPGAPGPAYGYAGETFGGGFGGAGQYQTSGGYGGNAGGSIYGMGGVATAPTETVSIGAHGNFPGGGAAGGGTDTDAVRGGGGGGGGGMTHHNFAVGELLGGFTVVIGGGGAGGIKASGFSNAANGGNGAPGDLYIQ